MKYAVNEAGISALQNISTVLMTSVADLFEKTSQLQTIKCCAAKAICERDISTNSKFNILL